MNPTYSPRTKRTLSSVKEGETVRISDIEGGRELRRRLLEMGFIPGAEIMIVVNGGGPVIVIKGRTRTAIGRGMAENIFVV
jgi:Fe2+ transport system protein FeoA